MSDQTGLRRNAVGLGGAIIMAAAFMGPAVSTFFNPQVVAASAGFATPFVFVVALVIMLVLASSIMEMARVFPSAGAFYTYVSRGVGPRSGFVTGGLMFLAYSLLVPAELALIGNYASDILATYGMHIPWEIISGVFIILMTFLSLRGISSSLRTAAVLFSIEVVVIVVLSAIVLARGGDSGINLGPLNPATSPTGLGGITLGLTFAMLSFVGFEAVTTLGEEVRTPRKIIPRALLFSLLFVGVIYLFCTFAEMIGFGALHIGKLVVDPAPFTTLAIRYAPWIQIPIGLAGISSIFAVIMNSNNGIVRILFAMGREGLLPAGLSKVHPVHRTPTNAVWLQAVVAVVFTFGVGLITGPFNAYVYLGSILTLAIIPVYILTNIATMRYFASTGRAERKTFRHIVLPVLGILLLAIPIFGQVYPVPPAPLSYFPYGLIVFIIVMALIGYRLGKTRPEVLSRAGAVLATGDADDMHGKAVTGKDDAGILS